LQGFLKVLLLKIGTRESFIVGKLNKCVTGWGVALAMGMFGVAFADKGDISLSEAEWLLAQPVIPAQQHRPTVIPSYVPPSVGQSGIVTIRRQRPPTVSPARRYNPNVLRQLPFSIKYLLQSSKIKSSGLSAFILGVGDKQPLMAYNENQARLPASVMKLVTTYSALGILGPNYRWKTEIYMQGRLNAGTLNGNLIVKGYGAPDFKTADLRTLLRGLRNKGIRNVNGNLIFDNSYFQPSHVRAGAFDGKPYAAYNAQPDALMMNGRVSTFVVQNVGGKARVSSPAPAANIKIVNKIKSVRSRCRGRARNPKTSISSNGHGYTMTFSGTFSTRCSKRVYKHAITDPASMMFATIQRYWQQDVGGQLRARFVRAVKPANARLLVTYHSAPLHQIIREVNKDSDNLMARQILLTMGAHRLGAPSTTRKGEHAVKQWLQSRGLHFPELRIDNGSGLSRWATISSRHVGELLLDAYKGPHRQYMLNSLAVAGVDGTMRKRLRGTAIKGRGHFKTGTLRNARAIAGYVKGRDGKMYIVSILHNDPSARSRSRKAHDELIKWAYWGGKPPQRISRLK
jgi:D-alanyl-D-alanine carboxypeptidase/D-alanyl-D-alanine-endopeptidase (penicillin-binding protein 4)